ncbi:hypothetical protein [Micromonospora palythoicola]|uniref:hypothetical protein n=1 Tax=Micromonospora palythoicola TaxID=3120507 RepID=UPI002FCE4353
MVAELERMLADSGVGAADDIEPARRSADGLWLFAGRSRLFTPADVDRIDAILTSVRATATPTHEVA